MTGTTFFRMIKQFYPGIEVIILNGSTDFNSYKECQEKNMTNREKDFCVQIL